RISGGFSWLAVASTPATAASPRWRSDIPPAGHDVQSDRRCLKSETPTASAAPLHTLPAAPSASPPSSPLASTPTLVTRPQWLQNDRQATLPPPTHSSECRGLLRSFPPSPGAIPVESWLSIPIGSSSLQNTCAHCHRQTTRLAGSGCESRSNAGRRTLSLLPLPASSSTRQRIRCRLRYLADMVSTPRPAAFVCAVSARGTCAR